MTGNLSRKIVLLGIGIAVCASLVSRAVAQQYDVVILNGRVIDPETGVGGIANVGIQGGWITRITSQAISGKEVIDAKGHVVAPGLIDLEQHGLTEWGFKVNLRDGVTTQMDFEVGALNIAEWHAKREGKLQANFGTTIGHEYSRMRIHDDIELSGPDVSMPDMPAHRAEAQKKDGVNGWSVTKSTLDQINAITKILDEGLREGPIGIGSLGGYAQKGITTYELLEVQRAGARWGRLTCSHHRFHPNASPFVSRLRKKDATSPQRAKPGSPSIRSMTVRSTVTATARTSRVSSPMGRAGAWRKTPGRALAYKNSLLQNAGCHVMKPHAGECSYSLTIQA